MNAASLLLLITAPMWSPLPAAETNQWIRYTTSPQGTNRVSLTGDAISHRWRCAGEVIRGTLDVTPQFLTGLQKGEATGTGIRASLAIPVLSLKSVTKEGKPYSDFMDQQMYIALHALHHPDVIFQMTELIEKEDQGSWIYAINGKATIAGVTQAVQFPAQFFVSSSNLVVRGELPLKMSSFNVKPPPPTEDLVNISFSWTLTHEAQ